MMFTVYGGYNYDGDGEKIVMIVKTKLILKINVLGLVSVGWGKVSVHHPQGKTNHYGMFNHSV